MENSEKKGLVKQYVNQAEKLFNENLHNKNPAMKKYMLGEALEKINLALGVGEDLTTSARAYCMRAKIHKAQGDLINAIKDMDHAIELNPQYIELYRTRAEFLAEDKRFNEAIKDYATVFELSKGKDWGSLFEIGNIYCENGEYDNAINYYTKSIDTGDAPPWVYGKRALAHAKAGNLPEAEKDKETANLPDWFFDIHPMFYKGVVGIIRGNYPELVKYIPAGQAHRSNPNGSTIVFGPRMSERAYDAKTGEYLWMS